MNRSYFPSPRPVLLVLCVLACGAAAADDNASQVEKCSHPLGAIAVSEPQSINQFSTYGLGSPVSVLRLMIQQSGCFDVVERGVAMQNLQQERALAAGGELQSGSNVGKGQMQAADFVMTPNVLFNANTGGVGGAAAGLGSKLFGSLGAAIGGIAGGLKFKEAQTSLIIADVRSGIQIAAEQGTAKKTDFSVGGWGYGSGTFASGSGYTKTPEGKMIAASLLDNYNKIVIAIRDRDSLIHTRSESSVANASGSLKAGKPVNEGDMVMPRINNVRVFADASLSSKVLGVLHKGEELISSGEERAGFIKIDSANISGWVQRTMVSGQ